MADVKVNRETSERGRTATGTEQQGTMTRQGHGREEISRQGGEYWPSLFGRSAGDLFSMSPFALMRHLSEEMDRQFGSFARGGSAGAWGGSGTWAPLVEVTERKGMLKVCAELPGLNKEDVKVDITDGILTIQGERKQEHDETTGGVRRTERSYGRFFRAIQLPDQAQLDAARAQFNNGVLEVTVPVPESKSNRREIPIEAGGPG